MYSYRYSGILLRHEKEWNRPFATTWMDLEVVMLSEISQIEKYCTISFNVESKKQKKWANIIKQRVIEIKPVVARGEGSGGRKEIAEED